MKALYRPCPICDSVNIENIRRISFNMDGIMPDFYFLARCVDCGFLYANTVATLQDYERYYAENNRYSNIPNQDTSTMKAYKKNFEIICKYVSKDDNILDIGCGPGDMLKLMKKDGYKHLTGIDSAQASIDKLSESGIYGIRGTIYDEPIINARGRFDVIILSGVLEHLYDLKKAVKNVRSYIKEAGKILCIVPNALEYGHYPSPLAHYINIEHINHFTPNSLMQLFAQNGFSLQECINTTISFGDMPDPALMAVFEYIPVKDIAYRKIDTMLLNDDLEKKGLITAIQKLVASKKKVAIWGAGNFSRSLLANTDLGKANIVCFLDNDASLYNKNFCGYRVNPPSFTSEFDGKILILSMHAFTEIEDQIRNMGFVSKIIYY